MKTNLKYYLMVAALMMVVSVVAQTYPTVDMQSTSSMMGSGSQLPSAANSGVSMAALPEASVGEMPLAPKSAVRGPRRVGEGEGFEEEEKPNNPAEPFPVGAMPWMLMLLLCGGYAAAAAYRRREEV